MRVSIRLTFHVFTILILLSLSQQTGSQVGEIENFSDSVHDTTKVIYGHEKFTKRGWEKVLEGFGSDEKKKIAGHATLKRKVMYRPFRSSSNFCRAYEVKYIRKLSDEYSVDSTPPYSIQSDLIMKKSKDGSQDSDCSRFIDRGSYFVIYPDWISDGEVLALLKSLDSNSIGEQEKFHQLSQECNKLKTEFSNDQVKMIRFMSLAEQSKGRAEVEMEYSCDASGILSLDMVQDDTGWKIDDVRLRMQ